MRENIKKRFSVLNIAYKKRFYARMLGSVVQGLIIGVGKGGYIRVSPVIYVVGANVGEDELMPTLCPELTDRQTWHFPERTPLDDSFAQEIQRRLEISPVVNVFSTLTSDVIDRDIRWFTNKSTDWSANLSLTFFNMTRGASTARADFERAKSLFYKYSRISSVKPLRDWEETLLQRFVEFETRLDDPNCIALCRADAETHARSLKLPRIVWPPDWPESVPPWPRESSKSWGDRVRGFLAS